MKKKRGVKRPVFETLFGVNPVREALRAGKRKFASVNVKGGADKSKALAAIIDAAGRRGVPVATSDIDTIAKRAGAEGHQGVVANVSPLPLSSLDRIIERTLKLDTPCLAVLDGVQDPRNLGAIIRSAEAFGLGGVIIPDRRSASYTPVAAKASAGAGEHLPICVVTNIAETIRRLRDEGFYTVAFEKDAQDVFIKPSGPIAIVMGGEGTGVRPLVIKRCDATAKIPIIGATGSLNVSVASAIAFYLAR